MKRYKSGDNVTSKSFNQMLNSVPPEFTLCYKGEATYDVRGVDGLVAIISKNKCDVMGKVRVISGNYDYEIYGKFYCDWMLI